MTSPRLCKICYESYDEIHRPLTIVPCGHVFGDSCIFELDPPQCPTCSSTVRNFDLGDLQIQSNLNHKLKMPPIVSSRKKKTVLLFGRPGVGKSSFINLLYGMGGPIAKVPDESAASKADTGRPFTEKSFFFMINHPILGSLDVIDTVGYTDDQSESELILKLALFLYNSNRELKVDVIIYFMSALDTKLSYEKDLSLLCQLFSIDIAQINNYLVAICTKCNSAVTVQDPEDGELNVNAQSSSEESRKIIKELEDSFCDKYRISFIRWDSKRPFSNQIDKLKMSLNVIYASDINFEMFDPRIYEVAEFLREQDKELILTVENLELEKKEIKDNIFMLKHSEDTTLPTGSLNITDFGVEKLYPLINDKFKRRIEPTFENGAQIKRIKNIRNKIIREEHVIDELLFAPKLSFDFDNDLTGCSIVSEIYFQPGMQAKSFIEYEIKYDIEYEMPDASMKNDYTYKSVELYKPKATEIFLSRLNDVKTPDKYTNAAAWNALTAEFKPKA